MITPPSTVSAEELESVLASCNAKLRPHEVRALYLGALCSTNLARGPQRLFDHIFGTEAVMGESMEEANRNLQTLMGFWNTLAHDLAIQVVRLSRVPLSEPPTRIELTDLAKQRADELRWFVKGIDAGGDDPMEFGERGEIVLRRLAEASALVKATIEVLARSEDAKVDELKKLGANLAAVSARVEELIAELSQISATVRAHAVAEFRNRAATGAPTDDGVPAPQAVKVGRNDPCPCGSGKKWKKCCGDLSGPVQ